MRGCFDDDYIPPQLGRPKELSDTERQLIRESMANDPVNRPAHYTTGKIEVIEMIEDQGFAEGFCLGNAIKYIMRAGKKDPTKLIEDLEKAQWYLGRYIAFLSNKKKSQP